MAEYRAFLLDSLGRVIGPAIIINAKTDAEAFEAAKQSANGHDVELWHVARFVATSKSRDVPEQ
jgi:hypothetical protein